MKGQPWENFISTSQKMKLDTYLIPSTNSKCIKGLIVRPNCKTPRRKHKRRALWHWICHLSKVLFFGYDTKNRSNLKKNRQHRRHETQKWLHIKGENQRSGRQPMKRKYLQITYLLRSECPEHVRNSYNSTTTTKYLERDKGWDTSQTKIYWWP